MANFSWTNTAGGDWTDGEAVLPLPALHGDVMLEIHLAGSMIYALEAATGSQHERCAA